MNIKAYSALKKEALKKFNYKIINGKSLANILSFSIKNEANLLINKYNLIPPKLKIIHIGNKQDSLLYIKNKIKKCEEIGFEVEIKMFEDTKDLDYSTIAKEIIRSGKDRNINGIILQLPLPLHLEPYKLQILNKIPKFKDVDGLNEKNFGINILRKNYIECDRKITAKDIDENTENIEYYINSFKNQFVESQNNSNTEFTSDFKLRLLYENIADNKIFNLVPPTALGVIEMLRLCIYFQNDLIKYAEWASLIDFESRNKIKNEFNLTELNSTVIGRSNVAGNPISILLQKLNSTVTTCHSFTKNTKFYCKNSDIIVSAVGKPLFIKNDYIKQNSIVIDVGINFVSSEENEDKKLTVGDVDFNEVIETAKYITTVPNGVGQLTVVMLLNNLLKAWKYQNGIYIFEETPDF